MIITSLGLALFFVFFLQFFRNPPRTIALDPLALLAPADGKVVAIEETVESDFLKQDCMVIAIFMNVHNVHINRAAASGEVVHRQYHKGRYLLAWNPKSSHLNERASLAIRNAHGTTLTRQIAGGLARRIVTYPNVGDYVDQGNEIGFIKFGSRVDLFFPKSYQVKVRLGQKVTGGETVLARLTN
jgi:phosphatidylserine decarboxylase